MAILDLLRGVNGVAAQAVGVARGTLEAAVLGAIGYLAIYVGEFDFTVLGIPEAYVPLAVGGVLIALRTAWGWADQIDPKKDNENKI